MMLTCRCISSIAAVAGLLLLVMAIAPAPVHSWTSNPNAFRGKPPVTMYMPPPSSSPSYSQPSQFTAQKMLLNPGNPRPRVGEPTRKNVMKLSNSVLASSDTLPSFPTAHGLLSPETVMRLEELTPQGHRSDALNNFLSTYRRQGPLSCLPMLSDPDVLPHLTKAMRDIAL